MNAGEAKEYIAGVDEVGRALCGAVVTAAVILDPNPIAGLMTLRNRKKARCLFDEIKEALCWAISRCEVEEIDHSIFCRRYGAMQRCGWPLGQRNLVDGNHARFWLSSPC